MIIFDFDLTLVDTSPIAHLREKRQWNAVNAKLSELKVYDGINEMLNELNERSQKLAIVTKSPDMVPRYFIEQYEWPINIVIGFHQVGKHRQKPDPCGLRMAMDKAGATPQDTFHVGDHPEDTQASRTAGITAIGAGWGLIDTQPLIASNPDYLFTQVQDMLDFFVSVIPATKI